MQIIFSSGEANQTFKKKEKLQQQV